jgi:hypothetical protein
MEEQEQQAVYGNLILKLDGTYEYKGRPVSLEGVSYDSLGKFLEALDDGVIG